MRQIMHMFQHREIHRNLSAEELIELASYFYSKCHGGISGANPFFLLASQCDLRLNQKPTERILKMAKAKDVDAFFKDGTLQLGTVRHYARSENAEIGDKLEDAPIVLIGERLGYTIATAVHGGYDHYIFCTMLGNVDAETSDGFGYDASFEIIDAFGFQSAIAKCIASTNFSFGRCVYTPYKAMHGLVSDDVSSMRMDHTMMDILGAARNFLKPTRFQHQREFRFAWRVPHETDAPIIIKCPAAIQFVRRN
jgi:hypothetical protein